MSSSERAAAGLPPPPWSSAAAATMLSSKNDVQSMEGRAFTRMLNFGGSAAAGEDGNDDRARGTKTEEVTQQAKQSPQTTQASHPSTRGHASVTVVETFSDEADVGQLLIEIQRQKEELTQVANERATLEVEFMNQLTSLTEENQKTIDNYQRKLKRRNQDYSQLQQEVRLLRENETAQSVLDMNRKLQQAEIDQLRVHLTKTQDELAHSEARLRGVMNAGDSDMKSQSDITRIQDLQSQLSESEEAQSALSLRCQKREKEIGELTARVIEQEHLIEENNVELQALREQVAALESGQSQCEDDRRSFESEIEILCGHVADLEQGIDNRQAEIDRLKAQIVAQEERELKNENDREVYMDEIEQLQKQLREHNMKHQKSSVVEELRTVVEENTALKSTQKYHDLQNEAVQLRARISELESNQTNKSQDDDVISAHKKTIASMTAELAKRDDEVKAGKAQLERLKWKMSGSDVDDIPQQGGGLEHVKERRKLERKIENLKAEKAECEVFLSSVTLKRRDLQSEVQKLREQTKRQSYLEEENEDLRLQLASGGTQQPEAQQDSANKDDRGEEIERLQDKIAELENYHGTTKASLLTSIEEIETLNGKINELEAANSNTEARLEARDRKMGVLHKQLKGAEEQIATLHAELETTKSKAGESDILHEQIVKSNNEIESLRSQIKALEATRTKADQGVEGAHSLRQQIVQLEETASKASDDMLESQRKAEYLQKQIAELEKAQSVIIKGHEQETELLQDQIRGYTETLTVCQIEREGIEVEINQLRNNLAECKAQRLDADEENMKKEQLIEEMLGKINAYEDDCQMKVNEIELLHRKVQEYEAVKAASVEDRRQQEDMADNLRAATTKCEDLQKQIDQLCSDISQREAVQSETERFLKQREDELERWRVQNEENKKIWQKAKKEREELSKKVAEYESVMGDVSQKEVVQSETERLLRQREDEIEQWRAQSQENKKIWERTKKERKELLEQITEYKTAVASLEEQQESHTTDLKRLRHAIAEYETDQGERKKLLNQIAEYETATVSFEAQQEGHKREMRRLRDVIAEYEAAQGQLIETQKTFEAEIMRLQKALEQQKCDSEMVQMGIQEKQDHDEEVRQLLEQLSEYESALSGMEKQLYQMTHAAEKHCVTKEALESAVKRGEKEIVNQQAKFSDAEDFLTLNLKRQEEARREDKAVIEHAQHMIDELLAMLRTSEDENNKLKMYHTSNGDEARGTRIDETKEDLQRFCQVVASFIPELRKSATRDNKIRQSLEKKVSRRDVEIMRLKAKLSTQDEEITFENMPRERFDSRPDTSLLPMNGQARHLMSSRNQPKPSERKRGSKARS